jgi:transposase
MKIYEWVESIKEGLMNAAYVAPSGRPPNVRGADIKNQIHQRIRDNLRISTDEISSEISISHEKYVHKNGL